MARANTMEDFWPRVDKRGPDECWPWLGHVNKQGYGVFFWHRRPLVASRLAYQLTNGITLTPGREVVVCHRCDNPPCCNPAHLFLGTMGDNNRDRDSKGRARGVKGSANRFAKFTDEQVREMRRLYAEGGWSYPKLGVRFGMHPQNTLAGAVGGE